MCTGMPFEGKKTEDDRQGGNEGGTQNMSREKVDRKRTKAILLAIPEHTAHKVPSISDMPS